MTSPDERVELVRRGLQAYNARDTGAVLRLFDPEVEIFSTDELMNAGTFRGHAGYVRWVRNWDEAWEDFQNTPEEIIAVGEHHVVARVRASGRGRGSGVEVGQMVGYVYEVREGLCVYMGLHPSFEEAVTVAREREGIAAETGAD
jgi:ketosteroid isomerase-like protein